ncbi:cathepsin G-like [Dermochelys coriacea]|uniref:cathepsin G-like n=1 Tax=Dermochelys coriacea TaxID=27794 RepID=UPI001CA8C385|nr:cathepsin G-like [Dermochelys coriacea]
MLLLLLLLPAAVLLPLRAQAGWIIGGNVSWPHSRPYMAYLEVRMGQVNTQICGGLLVKKDFVLTAAHCSCTAGNVTVILGAHNVHEPEETQQRLRVRRIIPHPEFTRDPLTNDLLLLQGDSGGPLVCNRVPQGIVSYGKVNGSPPAIYTRIAKFIPWIRQQMCLFQQ